MTQQTQQKGATKPPKSFDRKIRCEGYGRSVSLTKVLPPDWRYVRIRRLKKVGDTVIIKITKLLGVDENTQSKGTGKNHKQDTQATRAPNRN